MLDPADARADRNADPLAILGAEVEPGVGHGLAGGDDRELRAAGHPPRFLGVDVLCGVEVL